MPQKFFNIRYEFDRQAAHDAIERQIDSRRPGYVCVADGVILDISHRDPDYLKVIDDAMFSICDSSYVPVYIRAIHGKKFSQYTGSQIFYDIVSKSSRRMIFLGASREVLDALQKNISQWNASVKDMKFIELPFCSEDEFDYEGIAKTVADDGADIIWVSLGAPKQEHFMHRLLPHLDHGVMIAVGAAFKFHSGLGEKRAPEWMIRHHLEFIHRITQDPRKQFKRCSRILRTLPSILRQEIKAKKQS